MKKKGLFISIILLVIIGVITYFIINNNKYLFKAYLKENNGNYTLVIKNKNYFSFDEMWKIEKLITDEGHFIALPWIMDNRKLQITEVEIEDNIKVDSLALWFYGLENLKQIKGLDKIDTTDIISTSGMFYNCKSLEQVDLTNIITTKITTTDNMFSGCENLKTIYVNDTWNLDKVENSEDMFKDCFKIEGQDGTIYDEDTVDKEYAVIDNGLSIGYLSNKGFFKETEEDDEEYIEQGTLTDEDFENVD